MGKRLDKSSDKDEKAGPEAAKARAGEPAGQSSEPPQPQTKATEISSPPIAIAAEQAGSDLPMVESPPLGGGEAIVAADAEAPGAAPRHDAASPAVAAAYEAPSEPAAPHDEAAVAAVAQPRSRRFALLAASIALAAALGSFVGSLSASGLLRVWPSPQAGSRAIQASDSAPALKATFAELSTLKTNLDGVTRNTNGQFAKLAERLDRMERAAADPAAKLAHIVETVDRLEKRNAAAAAAAPETTGAIGSNQQAAGEINSDRPLDGWFVQGVQNGRALVGSRFGGLFDVSAGSFLPGLGRVEEVRRQDGHWVVVTTRGLITSAR